MAQKSGLWTTDASPAGHQVTSYTQATASEMLAVAAACSGFEGVAPGYLNELACSVEGANEVDVATGGAMVDGKYYINTDVVTLDSDDLPSPSGGTTRIDRIVLEVTWANFECVITVIAGTESGGTPSAPSIPTTAGTNYAIPLYQALINAAGEVTLTDERTWAIVPVDDSTIEDNGAGALRVKDSGITAAKIANRTRKFFVPSVEAYDSTVGGTAGDRMRTTVVGYTLTETSLSSGYGNFLIPQDFASGMTIKPIFYGTAGAGDVYYKTDVQYGAVGEAYNNHAHSGSYAALTVTADVWQVGASVSLTSGAADDLVSMRFYRDGTNGSDTFNGAFYFLGFIVEYTADS